MSSKFEQTVGMYWLISKSIFHPNMQALNTNYALKGLSHVDALPHTARTQRTITRMNQLRDNIIEGIERPPSIHQQSHIIPLKRTSQ